MNRRFGLIKALAIALVILGAGSIWAGEVPVRIIFFSNMPELEPKEGAGGLPELAGLVNQSRDNFQWTIFLHGGDSLAPSALSSFDRGTHMIDILNSLEPSVMAAAKREFAYREDELTLRSYEASFPIICANIYDPVVKGNLEGLEIDQLFEVGQYTIGVFAVIDPEVVVDYSLTRLELLDMEKVIQERSRSLKSQGADLIVLMADFSLPHLEKYMAEGLIDIYFEIDSTNDVFLPTKNGIIGKQGSPERNALIVDLVLKGQGADFSWTAKTEVVSLGSLDPDPEVAGQVQSYLKQIGQLMDTVIGITVTPLDTTRASVRLKENAFCNMVADALREYYKADIALINGGGVRGDRFYEAGTELTRRDIDGELPFRNRGSLLCLTGKQIRAALENGFSRIKDVKGRFPHFSGMKVKYAPTAPVGRRVKSVLVAGEALSDDKEYTVATLDFLAGGGDGYDVLKKGIKVSNIGGDPLYLDIVRDYISKKKRISPRVEGRLTEVAD